MKFTWDWPKAEINLSKHQISFEEAQTVFDDPIANSGQTMCIHSLKSASIASANPGSGACCLFVLPNVARRRCI